MKEDPKIEQLLKRIAELAAEIEKSRQELGQLYQEVKKLSPNHSQLKSPPHSPSQTSRPRFSIENFVGLKLIHFIGIIALVMGLAIGVKYAIDRNLISPLLRIVLAYLAAAVLFLISFVLRRNYRLFSLILFGGSAATAYFTTYGAFAYYQLLPLIASFMLMLLLAVATIFHSIKYNSQELAVLALVGGYGIPFLVRGSAENWMGLMSYIFIINLAVSYLSFKRYWPTLVYLSFGVTWFILLFALYFRMDRIGFTYGLIFSIVYFILFLVNTSSFKIARRQQLQTGDVLVLLTNITLLYFALFRLFNFETFEALSGMTTVFAVACLAGAYIEKMIGQSKLQKGLMLFGLFLLIILVPMRFEQLTITIVWMLMAAILFVMGLWRKVKLLRLASIVLFAATLVKLVAVDSLNFTAIQKVVSYILLGTILLVISFLYQKFKNVIFEEDND